MQNLLKILGALGDTVKELIAAITIPAPVVGAKRKEEDDDELIL